MILGRFLREIDDLDCKLEMSGNDDITVTDSDGTKYAEISRSVSGLTSYYSPIYKIKDEERRQTLFQSIYRFSNTKVEGR